MYNPVVLALLFSACLASKISAQSAVYPVQDSQRYAKAKTGGNYMYNYYLPPAGTGTPWWPAWHPDGKSLVFSLQGSLWQMAIDDSVAREMLHTSHYLSSPSWSPNGQYLVFTSDDGIGINLKQLEVSTGNVLSLTRGDHLNLDPAWSPDGSKLAYVSTQPDGYFNIFIVEFEEGKPGQTIAVTADVAYGKDRLYFGNYDLHIQPTWSPDGKEIIAVSNHDIPLGSGGIWRMPAVENGFDSGVVIHKEETLYRTRPHWSPDGSRIIYSSHLGGQFNNLFVLPVIGGEPYKITFGDWDAFHPRWSPDGHLIAYLSNQPGPPELRLLQTFGGRERILKVKKKEWAVPVGHVEVTVVDLSTRERLAARVYNKAFDGKSYVPDGEYHRLGRGLSEHFFHTDGGFILEVPAGKMVLEVMRGFEYYPEAVTAEIVAGDTAHITVELSRIADLKSEGWYSGSNHVHMNYAGNLHNTPANLMYMAEAEDLSIIGEMICNKDNRIMDYQFFTGDVHPISNDKQVLYFNEEYRPPFYGHVSLINLKEHLISPFTTGYEGTAIESLYPSNTDIFRLAREQGALGAYVHPYFGSEDPLKGSLGGAKSFPVDVALQTVDYHELVSFATWAGYDVWHKVLNNGFNVPAVGGEDAISNLHHTAIIGQMRAYGYMNDGLSWDGWVDAIRKGALFVTNGPLLRMTVDGHAIGESIAMAKSGTVSIKGRVQSIVPLDKAELVVNGEKIDLGDLSQHRGAHGETDFTFNKTIRIKKSSWITLQAYNNQAIHPLDDQFAQATTNPVWVIVGDQPVRSETSAEYFIQWVDKLTEMAAIHPGWRSEHEKEHVLGQFDEARRVYEKRKAEAGKMGMK